MAVARFTPQAWVNDYAIEVDAEGPREWDCTVFLATFSESKRALAVEGGSYEADDLRADPAAPEWVQNWQGPFEIHVEV